MKPQRAPPSPCYYLTATSRSTTSKTLSFHNLQPGWFFFLFFLLTFHRNGKRHQSSVICDPNALRRVRLAERHMSHERINPDEWVHGEYLVRQRNEGSFSFFLRRAARVNYWFILCGLWGETVCLKIGTGVIFMRKPFKARRYENGKRTPSDLSETLTEIMTSFPDHQQRDAATQLLRFQGSWT